jgi:hypothetical protein
MTTIATLVLTDRLVPYEPGEADRRQSFRLIYMTPHFQDWMADELSLRRAPKKVGEMPLYQLIGRFDDFCMGENFELNRMFKNLEPKDRGIWEIKTPDVRVFGFFTEKDCFIAIRGGLKSAYRTNASYKKPIGIVGVERQKLQLPWISGERIDDVISIKN